MEQQAIRFSLRELDIPVVHWDGEQSLDLTAGPVDPAARHGGPPVTARPSHPAPRQPGVSAGAGGVAESLAAQHGPGWWPPPGCSAPACVAWAAVPLRAARPRRARARGGRRLLRGRADRTARRDHAAPAGPAQLLRDARPGRPAVLAQLRQVPWAEGAVLAALVLEVLHPARPWHTAVLGVALLGYLLGTHLAEADPVRGTAGRVLRAQLPVLAAGLGLLVLAAASHPAAGRWRRRGRRLAAYPGGAGRSAASGLALPV